MWSLCSNRNGAYRLTVATRYPSQTKLGYDDALDAFGCHAWWVTGVILTGLSVCGASWTEHGACSIPQISVSWWLQVLGILVTVVFVASQC